MSDEIKTLGAGTTDTVATPDTAATPEGAAASPSCVGCHGPVPSPWGDDARVGVFVCDCGTNIAATVDVPAVAEFAKDLPGVVASEEGKWICSVDYLNRIKTLVKEQDLNRVVVACCTPRTHEPLFKKTVAEAGMNAYQLEFVSIREQVSWVHKTDMAKATAKAKDLVRMGVAKSILLEEGEEIRLPVETDCLVIGGGAAGMTAALAVADQGYEVHIVEREPQLGGLLNKVSNLAPFGVPASQMAADLVAAVQAHEHIEVLTSTELTDVAGYIGNYKVTVGENGSSRTFGVSTVITTTGMRELTPEGQFGYGTGGEVVTQLELEQRLRDAFAAAPDGVPAESIVGGAKHVVMIQCVNSRNEQRGCCTIGCPTAIKNARAIKAADPEATVTILYRDLITVKEEYANLKEVMREGIRFARFADDRYPEVERVAEAAVTGPGAAAGTPLQVKVFDVLLGKELTLPADLVVLATAFQGDPTVTALRGMLKVSASDDGFFQEAHVKLGPVDFAANGIYLAGSARSPKALVEVREEALGAAMRASIPMTRGYVEAEGIVADVDLSTCSRCGLCSKNCPYGAFEVNDEKEPSVLKALCKGCGLCAADCPKDSITIVHYSDPQIAAQIDAALAEDADKKIVAFVCHWCALGAVDIAGVGRQEYPTPVRIIRVMCSARVAHDMVEHAFDQGAAGVLVAGCEFPTCHYITGNYKCQERMVRTRKKLEKKGYDTSKLWEVWLSAAMGPKWVATQKEMVHALGLED
jgi:heterodisulfide reductase subunit A